MNLFSEYQIPSDLLRSSLARSASLEAKLADVQAHVDSMHELIKGQFISPVSINIEFYSLLPQIYFPSAAKRKELEEIWDRKIFELLAEVEKHQNEVDEEARALEKARQIQQVLIIFSSFYSFYLTISS